MLHRLLLRETRGIAIFLAVGAIVSASCQKTVYVQVAEKRTPVVPEPDDEKPGRAPHADSLGGPYGEGRPGSYPQPRPTPRPPARIDQAMSDATLVKYLNSLVYEMSRDRTELALLACRTSSGMPCPANDGVPVFIQPEIGMNLVDPATIGPEGVVVARIINFDTQGRPEATIGFPAAKRTWWYVYKENGVLRSRFFTRTHDVTKGAVAFMDTVMNFRKCPGHPDVIEPAMAKWRSCRTQLTAATTPASPVGAAVAAWSHFAPARFAPGSPRGGRAVAVATDTWIKCMANCCGD